MKIRLYNARILTMTHGPQIEWGEVWVEGNTITYVGDMCPSNIEWDREIDVDGNVLMPGFVNAHSHSAMTFLRSAADDLPLLEWLEKQVFPMEAKLTPEYIYHFTRLAILEYLTSGITTNFDMYMTPDTIFQAAIDMGFRTVICGGVNNFSQSVELIEEWFNKYNNYHDLTSFIMGFSHEYTSSKELLEEVSNLVHKYQVPVFTHNSETAAEVAQCVERTGMTPTVWIDSLGLYDFGGGGFHCVHMTEEDLDIFEKRGLTAVTNPGSNLKLASGIAPIVEMQKRGINIAIGTDGAASNNCLDMFREMFLVTGLAKIANKDASVVNAYEVLQMATVNGAKALGLNCGKIEEGALADMIIVDLHQPNMQPLHNIVKNIVYSGSKANVKMTMVNGRVLYENGTFFVGYEPEEIYRTAQQIMEKL